MQTDSQKPGVGIKFRFLSFFRNDFFYDRNTRVALIAAAATNSILWVAILIKTHAESKPIPLHFNAFYDIEFVGSGFLFLQLPFIGFVLLVANTFLSRAIYPIQKFLALFIGYASVAIQIVLLVATVSIIVLNS